MGIKKLKFFIFIASFVFSGKVFSEEKEFCVGQDFFIYGSACWPFNVFSYPRVEKKGVDNLVTIDMKIPFFLFEKSSYRGFGPHTVIVLSLNVGSGLVLGRDQHESLLIINVSHKSDDEGIRLFVESLSNKKEYVFLGERNEFYMYKANVQATAFNYFVPKQMPPRAVYMSCVKNCSMFSVYRNVSYEFSFPSEWKDNYLSIQKLVELFFDSIIVSVNIKGAH